MLADIMDEEGEDQVLEEKEALEGRRLGNYSNYYIRTKFFCDFYPSSCYNFCNVWHAQCPTFCSYFPEYC